MSEDEIRIKLLEYVGWTGLTRKGRLVEGAMRGYDPKDGVFKIAPNPTKSLDSLRVIEERVRHSGDEDGEIWYAYMENLDRHAFTGDAPFKARCLYDSISN